MERVLFTLPIWTQASPATWRVLCGCYAKAAYQDGVWNGIPVPAGSLITSRHSMAQYCRVTEKELRCAFSRLESDGIISVKGAKRYTIVTLLLSDSYVDSEGQKGQSEEGPEKGQTKGQTKGQSELSVNQAYSKPYEEVINQKGQTKGQSKGGKRATYKQEQSSSSGTKKQNIGSPVSSGLSRTREVHSQNSLSPLGDDDEAAIAANPEKALRELFLAKVGRHMDKRLRQKIQDALLRAGVGLPAYITELKIRIPLLREKVGGGFFLQQAQEFGETAETEVQKRSMAVDITTAKVLSMQPPKVTVALTEGCGCTGGMLMQNGQYGYCSCEKGAELKRKESK